MKYELNVNRKELIDGLNLLGSVAKPKKNMEAVLSFEKGNFVVRLNGGSIGASAEGEFPGIIRISAILAIKLAKMLPLEDTLTVAHDEKRLYIGTFAIQCTWHNVEPYPAQLPIDPSLPVLLGLRFECTQEQILHSGYSKSLDQAERKRKRLITKAMNTLKILGVERVFLEKLVDENIKRINKTHYLTTLGNAPPVGVAVAVSGVDNPAVSKS